MNVVAKLIEKIETKTERDLLKAIVGLIAGFAMAKIAERAYESAVGPDEDEDVVMETN